MNKRNGYLEWLLGREEKSKSQKGKDRKTTGPLWLLSTNEPRRCTVALRLYCRRDRGFRFTRRGRQRLDSGFKLRLFPASYWQKQLGLVQRHLPLPHEIPVIANQ
ncbi:hypothetical protein FOFC_01953 [Fusarium oxysporum]|nr:hypothetical protein FOFC_01953 [Fusarium oxysporum]